MELIYLFLTVACSLAILYGLTRLSKVTTAVSGNKICWIAMVIAMLATILKDGSYDAWYIWASVIAGCAIGLFLSNKVKMIEMPQLVAFLNGIGGGSAGIVGFLILIKSGQDLNWFVFLSSGLAVLTGMMTISGAFVAAGKLARLLPQQPVVLKNHNLIINIIIGAMLIATLAITFSGNDQNPYLWSSVLLVLGLAFGIIFTVRVGGADMPITISLLNSLAGISGAIAGFAIGDIQLVAIGGIVGSAGLLLTQVMCRAMNKHLFDILLGKTAVGAGKPKPAAAAKPAAAPAPQATGKDYGALLRGAKKVIIVPGYGMALAQAQHKVKQLADALVKNGAEVNYAIHPVAGRMPGHMNVLLAECNVDYEQLLEMDTVNPMFKDTDVVIVVGANDVVNPAAMQAEGTPIYGMPILRADEAKNVIVCNYDTKPGYAGVDNPLYTMDSAIMMLGDASETMDKLLAGLSGADTSATAGAPAASGVGAVLNDAKKVIIVPGYGMALAQAQQKVKQLADTLEAKGAKVDFAIHPVAGRMPGHMNVLLAEANVDYEQLLEMDTVNPMFKDTDVVIVVGANDVVNPAAMEAEGTPIYGMPILTINDAKHIIICNFDTKPGYAGVDNPLYTSDKVTMMLGDASQTVQQLMDDMATAQAGGGAGAAGGDDLPAILQGAKKVIIVPGYGMALAQAQQKVKQLADTLEAKGTEVDFAIHPVAGRMPGHMNVLLAEANVDYEQLLEMDTVNPMFKDTDVVIVVGANDVVNPAAMEAEGTPIYGMPILTINDAKHIVICNFDTKPGYAGVDNPLYTSDKVTMKLGDAAQTVQELIDACSAPVGGGASAAPAAGGVDLPSLVQNAKKVIIVPGYGMALAQAQQKVKQLADTLEAKGADVEFAIHPVAGRMPGHMNVLLAEANVEYEKLLEMDTVNPMFPETDLVIVVGANDVVNPAAMEAEGTPIYGMPILRADAAKNVIVCNFDTKPGYAGVDNPLYEMDTTIMLLGDASETVQSLIDACSAPVGGGAAAPAAGGSSNAEAIVAGAKKVIIVPGYGMALAQAQQKVKQLADTLEANGAEVEFAIHPVAGRMPGHMNVLLAEANVDYEKLLEMDTVNPMFPETDLVVVIGANDVVNPAAMEAEGTPIYGMPILRADEAKSIIVCNFDDKPGYAGVDNPLYTMDKTIMMLGDAADTVDSLIKMVPKK